ncbi:MAG: phosphoglucosamine mutase [Candidatus Hadarchaeum sp.]|uniref:phosphoglucosamine mutase n=1 Tax=Candidatus Hadarchaeum sp. TaxID=2883567 RepID=UPI0031762330
MGRLFGTSGARGLVGKQITPKLVMDLGQSLASLLGNSGTVVVGKDPRTSSDLFESCLISGLLSGGCDVKRLGVVPTPAVSFAVRNLRAKAGVMITASHNPPDYNGVKFFDSFGMAYTPLLEGKVERIYFGKKWRQVSWKEIGEVEDLDILPDYISALVGAVQLSRGYKVVVDCGNGAASVVAPELLRRVGCKVISMNSQPDGLFPGRPPEPSAENLVELCRVVRATESDLGIAHDGDADRVVFVSENGSVASGDEVLAIVASSQVTKKGDVVVTTVDASNVVDEVVSDNRGKVVRTKVGDVSVAAEIKRRGAMFGGEPCGAWIFPRFSMAPESLLGALKVLELMDVSRKKISELLGPLPKYYMLREKIACSEEQKTKLIALASKKLVKEFSENIGVLKVDGVRVNLLDGWVLVRASGTEPYVRVTAEARTPGRAEEILSKTVKLLKKII